MFRSASSTFDTQWPKWAYQIAMAAYLYDKQIQVVAAASQTATNSCPSTSSYPYTRHTKALNLLTTDR
jgi:hypothetical protein